MPIIKPISDLRNYNTVLKDVAVGSPVYLTKNGHGAYAIVDIRDHEEFEKIKAALWLMTELDKGVSSADVGKVADSTEIRRRIMERWNDK